LVAFNVPRCFTGSTSYRFMAKVLLPDIEISEGVVFVMNSHFIASSCQGQKPVRCRFADDLDNVTGRDIQGCRQRVILPPLCVTNYEVSRQKNAPWLFVESSSYQPWISG
jgi:hypothetical protein